MQTKRFRTMLATALMVASLAPMGVFAGALDASATQEVITAQSSATVPMNLNTEQATFSVTVPAALPVLISKDGVVVTADNATITNNSPAQVKITDITLSTQGSWKTANYDTFEANSVVINTKQFAIKLFEDVKTTDESGTLSFQTGEDYVIGAKGDVGKNSKKLTYEAKAPAQGSRLNGEAMANIVITIGWNS